MTTQLYDQPYSGNCLYTELWKDATRRKCLCYSRLNHTTLITVSCITTTRSAIKPISANSTSTAHIAQIHLRNLQPHRIFHTRSCWKNLTRINPFCLPRLLHGLGEILFARLQADERAGGRCFTRIHSKNAVDAKKPCFFLLPGK